MSRLTGRKRAARNTITTKSGKTIKVNRSLNDRSRASKAEREAKRAAYLSTLPKERWKRWAYRLKPKHLIEFWFSRDGALMALKLIGATIVFGFFVTIGLFAYFRKDLPQIKDLSGDNLGGNITYYDRTGTTVLFNDYNSVKRIPVSSQSISPYMKEATVAVEDKDFYKEGAFDVRGIIRAAYHDAAGGGGSLQGGSTITQQLVKLNEGWTDDRTITRKVKELILAVELERQYSKDDILTGYLNIAPYGSVDYGVQAAAEDYFQTNANQLTLAQASMLAAIPQSPSYYSPYAGTQFNSAVTDPTFSESALLDRQHYILKLMAQQGYITSAQATAAAAVNVVSEIHAQENKYQNIKAPYFVLAAKQQLTQTYGATTVSRGGWKVITTLNLTDQNEAEALVANNLKNVERAGGDEEATVTENVPTGQIMALVGGVNFDSAVDGQDNYAAGIQIPPGSSFKPYDYTTLINDNNNVGAGSVFYDSESPLPGYPCTNHAEPLDGGNCLEDYDFEQPGAITVRYAFGGSRNIPAVKAMLESVPGAASTGSVVTSGDIKAVNKTISTASAMIDNSYDEAHHLSPYNCYSDAQLTKLTQCFDSSAIGDGAYLTLDDHVNGLATIAREGVAIPRTYILKITDGSGKNIYTWKQPTGSQVVRKDAAYIVDNMASDPRASYLPGSCTTTTCDGYCIPTNCVDLGSDQKFQRFDGWDFAVKTGTTNNNFDGLMTSWSTQYAVVSWVGNHTRNVALNTSAMEDLTEPLTRGMMQFLHTNLKPDNWTQPTDIKTEASFVVRNHIHYGDEEPSPTDDIYPSWYVGGGTTTTKSTAETIDKVSGLEATSCTPADAKEYEGSSNSATWNIDIFANHGTPNIGTTSSAATTSSTATDNIHNCNDSPPTVSVTATDANSGQANVCDNKCTITVTATQGTHPLSGGSYTTSPAATVSVSLAGKVINTTGIPAGSSNVYSYSFSYSPSSSGSGALSATAVDSVLYSGTGSTNISYAAAGAITISSPSSGSAVTGSALNVSWGGGSGTYNVTVSNGGVDCTTTGNTCTVQLPNTGSYTIDITDSSGDSSSPVTVTRSS
jgi:membrane peptidoglycan carboxypeptidase